jgi:hypothetical protein
MFKIKYSGRITVGGTGITGFIGIGGTTGGAG